MSSRIRIIVTGLVGQHPLGGVCWDYIQYPVGLLGLGHDVYYFEDSGEWPYRLKQGIPDGNVAAGDCQDNVAYLRKLMAAFGLGDRWAYRCPIDGTWAGLSDARRTDVLRSADLLLNISGTLAQPETYHRVTTKAYIDSDPVFTQIKLVQGRPGFKELVDFHDVHFSFGEGLSCLVPETGHRWHATRQPILLNEWTGSVERRDAFTTVMNWASYASESWQGRSYGQKNVEFARFLALPERVAPTEIEIAGRGMGYGEAPGSATDPDGTSYALLASKGFRLADASVVCPDFESYRSYIASSKAEWSVAKNGYVTGQSGWFSCRSACYLAAGKPVVVQDTGFGHVLPVGEGILPFTNLEQAVDGVRQVESAYERHARAAREIAEQYFDSDKVLHRLIEVACNRTAEDVDSRAMTGSV